MPNTIARIKQAGKHFEIVVDMDDALKFKKGVLSSIEVDGDRIFTNSKRGEAASTQELETAFGTSDLQTIVEKIIKNGEVQTTQEHRNAEQEQKVKQIVDFLARNAIDPQTKNPHTPERIRSAIEQAHINVKNVPIENQISDIVAELSKVIPIKIETKKVRIIIPATSTGQAYGVVTQYKEEETWKDDGSLEIVVKVPAGIIIDFYERLNSVTHGSALTEEINE